MNKIIGSILVSGVGIASDRNELSSKYKYEHLSYLISYSGGRIDDAEVAIKRYRSYVKKLKENGETFLDYNVIFTETCVQLYLIANQRKNSLESKKYLKQFINLMIGNAMRKGVNTPIKLDELKSAALSYVKSFEGKALWMNNSINILDSEFHYIIMEVAREREKESRLDN